MNHVLLELNAKLREGGELQADEVEAACDVLLDEGNAIEERAEFLRLLGNKGETPGEIATFVDILLRRSVTPELPAGPLLDVCGTGGDRAGLFNISTAVMFVAAACGARVVKHGNRGITSKSGGADVLEALGIRIDLPPEQAGSMLERAGCCFLFAPLYHPAFKAVGPVRKLLAEQGTPTIFNKLGPLLNPARPSHQLAGVFDPALPALYAETFRLLGRKKAWAAHGTGPDGLRLDEVSSLGVTSVVAMEENETSEFVIHPGQLGIVVPQLNDLLGGDANKNARILTGILSGQDQGPAADIVLLNSAAALVVAGRSADLLAGLASAREAIASGRTMQVLSRLR